VSEKSTSYHVRNILSALDIQNVVTGLTATARRSDEIDAETLRRVFDEYVDVRSWVYTHTSPKQREVLARKEPHTLVAILREMLDEHPLIQTARNAEAATCAHCNGPCVLVPQ